MKLDPSKRWDQPFYWVAHPDCGTGYMSGPASRGAPVDSPEAMLISRRYDIEILGGIDDEDASYYYDEFALCRLDNDYYLLNTAGCSCPSPTETWTVEIGPATLADIAAFVRGGHYSGYTLPKQREAEFLALIEGAAQANVEDAHGVPET